MLEAVRRVLEEQHGLKIIRPVGRGGFAEVYEAESVQGVRCAVKVSLYPLDGGVQGIQSQALQKELDNLHLVQTIVGHPHVVTLMDYWVIGGYLVTRWELATEGSLADLLAQYKQEGRQGVPLDRLLRYTYEAADGIDFLNGRGIYHRDIKPQNLLLFYGRVKLADLGLAKFAGAATASHTGSGTWGYLPPEAYEDHRLSKTLDLYSLAATYVKLRTGREPFGTNPHEMVKRQERGDPIVDGLEDWEIPIVRSALAFDPEKRFAGGARKWALALSRAAREPPPAPAASDSPRPPAHGKQVEFVEPPPVVMPPPIVVKPAPTPEPQGAPLPHFFGPNVGYPISRNQPGNFGRLPPQRRQEACTWALFLHLSVLLGYIVPLAGLVVPILVWQLKRNELPELDVHGKIVVNWIISYVIYAICTVFLSFLLIGIPLLIALAVASVIFPIIGGIKANSGVAWNYPLAIPFLK